MGDATQIVSDLIFKSIDEAEKGNIKESKKYLSVLVPIIKELPIMLWSSNNLTSLAKALFIAYHFDLSDDEDENILISHFAFMYICHAEELLLKDEENIDLAQLFETRKQKVIILKACEDSLAYTISTFYRPHDEEIDDEKRKASLYLANKILPIIQYNCLMSIDEDCGGFQDDQFLEDTCNDIETSLESYDENLTKEAKNVEKLLYSYIRYKVKNKDLSF